MADRIPLGKLLPEAAADRKALAATLTTPAGQARAAAWAAGIDRAGEYEKAGAVAKVPAALTRAFFVAPRVEK